MSKDNPFAVFYNTSVEIGEVTDSGGYSEPNGEYLCLGKIDADIQPYSGGLAEKEYGLTDEVEKRMFCDVTDLLKTGRFVRTDEELYETVYVEAWEFGIVALLRRRRDIYENNGTGIFG